MATIKQGILGGFSGKVAGVVGTSWKGIAVMKSLPLSVANPKTAAQVGNRSSFKAASQFLSFILVAIVKPLWDRFAIRESGFNASLRANKEGFDSNGDIVLENIVISEGTLTPLQNVGFGDAETGSPQVEIDWSPLIPSGSGALTDKIYAMAVNKNTGEVVTSSAIATRATEIVALVFTEGVSVADEIASYIAPLAADGRLAGPQATKVQIIAT